MFVKGPNHACLRMRETSPCLGRGWYLWQATAALCSHVNGFWQHWERSPAFPRAVKLPWGDLALHGGCLPTHPRLDTACHITERALLCPCGLVALLALPGP